MAAGATFHQSLSRPSRVYRGIGQSVRDHWQQKGQPDRLLLSFHGIPERYTRQGDPYGRECRQTAHLLAQALGLEANQWQISFQSRVGREVWLQPYTDQTLKQWAGEGVRRVDVICPGFPADCLETIEEIGEENRDYFLNAGGIEYHYIPALNSGKGQIGFLSELAREHLWRDD